MCKFRHTEINYFCVNCWVHPGKHDDYLDYLINLPLIHVNSDFMTHNILHHCRASVYPLYFLSCPLSPSDFLTHSRNCSPPLSLSPPLLLLDVFTNGMPTSSSLGDKPFIPVSLFHFIRPEFIVVHTHAHTHTPRDTHTYTEDVFIDGDGTVKASVSFQGEA